MAEAEEKKTMEIPVGGEKKRATEEEVRAAIKAYLDENKPLEITHVHKADVKSFGDHMIEIGWEMAGAAAITAVSFGVAYGLARLFCSGTDEGTGTGE